MVEVGLARAGSVHKIAHHDRHVRYGRDGVVSGWAERGIGVLLEPWTRIPLSFLAVIVVRLDPHLKNQRTWRRPACRETAK